MNDLPRFNIPKELSQLLARESYSLLIKGASGTGKTSLALTILGASDFDQNFLYMSTNNSPHQIFESRSWLSTRIPEDLGAKHEGTLSVGRGSFVDCRLDEQSSVYERVTNELMDERAPLIVIDSWDAIMDPTDPNSILTNLKVLQIWRERARAKLIFTCQDTENSNFEFLLDGVIALDQRFIAGRRVREIMLSKLQGVEISRPSYFFTLSEGIFRSFEPARSQDFLVVNSTSRMKRSTHHTQQIPTGYPEIDDVLSGGLRPNSVSTIEIDRTVDLAMTLSFLRRVMEFHISNGGVVLIRPSNENQRDRLKEFIDSFSMASGRNLLRVFQDSERSGNIDSNFENHRKEAERRLQMFKQEVFDLEREFQGKKLLTIFQIDTLMSESEQRRNLALLVELAKSKLDLLILIRRKRKLPNPREFQGSDAEFEMVNMNGTFFLATNVPWSQFYALVPEGNGGKRTIELGAMI